jgi:hypothetical protein
VDINSVIVSSLRALHEQSLKDLSIFLKCEGKEMNGIGRKLSEVVIAGSLEIWRACARKVVHNEDTQVREVYRQEALMAGDEQVTEETCDQAKSEANEREGWDLTDQAEAAIEVDPASEEEVGQ